MAERIQMSRQNRWRAEHPDAIIVDRRTKWGNPFIVHKHSTDCGVDLEHCDMDMAAHDAAGAVRMFRRCYELRVLGDPILPTIREIRAELAGRDLACWCPLDQPCHADILLEFANEPSW